jgi:hypothetical protein
MGERLEKHKYHRFLDEAGDTTFYGKGKIPIIGNNGVSNYFIMGMLTIKEPILEVRKKIISLQENIEADPYLFEIPSIQKKKRKMGYFFHAKDDVPEVRKVMFEFIKSIDCNFDAVIGKKDYNIYERKHNGKQAEFYADMLSHLLHSNINGYEKLVLNIAHRSRCTTHTNLQLGLQKAIAIASHKYPNESNCCEMVFNVQQPTTEPLINIVDYFLWALQRKIEKEETRYFKFIENQINSITNLYSDEEHKL